MALYLFRDLDNELNSLRPSQLLDQHFGLGLHPDDLLAPFTVPQYHPHPHHHSRSLAPYYRPWRLDRQDSGSVVKADKDKFQVNLDVQQFKPEEITVKAVDNYIVVEGKHEEKQDEHGFISRHFVRKYLLPQGHDVGGVASSLSSDGILTITAPKVGTAASEEKVIPITHTGPHKSIKGKEEAAPAKK